MMLSLELFYRGKSLSQESKVYRYSECIPLVSLECAFHRLRYPYGCACIIFFYIIRSPSTIRLFYYAASFFSFLMRPRPTFCHSYPSYSFFFLNETAPPEISPLPLPAPLPI